VASRQGTLPSGSQVDRYVVGDPLGQGGFGVVYKARHEISGREVALKVLREEKTRSSVSVERFFREARAAASAGSKHIVAVLDCGVSSGGQCFLAMELLEGKTLQAMLLDQFSLPLDRALSLTLQLLDGLAVAHAAGVVHRDLKPANIFVSEDSERPGRDLLRILDFGVSKVLVASDDAKLTQTGAVLGTPEYMAPEQCQASRDVDGRADLYSVAVLLFRLLTGRSPHSGPFARTGDKAAAGRRTPLRERVPGITDQLEVVIDRGLEADPEARWQKAEEMAAALQEAVVADGALDELDETALLVNDGRTHVDPPVLSQSKDVDGDPFFAETAIDIEGAKAAATSAAVPSNEPKRPLFCKYHISC